MSSQLPQQRLSVPPDVDEHDFYTTPDGRQTLVTHSDLEAAVDNKEKPALKEVKRYWLDEPYTFAVIYENVRENEYRYIVVEPRLTDLEEELLDFFRAKLKSSLNEEIIDINAGAEERKESLIKEAKDLMKRYRLMNEEDREQAESIKERFKRFTADILEKVASEKGEQTEGVPAPTHPETGEIQRLTETQSRKLLYYLTRDFIAHGKIQPIKSDPQIEDISADGYHEPVFVYHSQFGEQLITNVVFGQDDLDRFVKTMAQKAGKGISKKQPNVDATLQDGSRAQLTLGEETSTDGSNFTIRQFNDIPFTPVDLINWQTLSIDQMAYLWLAIENGKSAVFAGGTATGKTTCLNAASLFMPSTDKIVSIEDTRELEIPQANWVPRVTRESFSGDDAGTVDEYDLLEQAMRMRPDYVLMGEVRGDEGKYLFQMLNTGHTTYTTFHADSPEEVIRRFTSDPINVPESMFGALDMIIQLRTVDIGADTVRRVPMISEVESVDSAKQELNLQDAYIWDRANDEYRQKSESSIIKQIQDSKNWSDAELTREWNYRRLVLAYMVAHNMNSYKEVAGTVQTYMSSPETVLGLISDGKLEQQIAALNRMKTVNIDIPEHQESLIPRPTTPDVIQEKAEEIITENESLLVGMDSSDVLIAEEDKFDLDDLSEEEQELIEQISADHDGELPEDMRDKLDTTTKNMAGISALDFGDDLSELTADSEVSDEPMTSERLAALTQDATDDEYTDIEDMIEAEGDSVDVDEPKDVNEIFEESEGDDGSEDEIWDPNTLDLSDDDSQEDSVDNAEIDGDASVDFGADLNAADLDELEQPPTDGESEEYSVSLSGDEESVETQSVSDGEKQSDSN